ncbi:putative hydrolase or acyltransferase of alpha/beta superfamily [Sphaerochaeta pleomorpha str. Grapes]|uniref:Putative hydrolase or acyltransferase of alpha/beta superfamily n=1 Tax=Sphaerochaeta pleomorpha (strain ATCC BAA-1885 / DSM 22778 / Grapes) TaxID=158190 RepID=G8QSX5_SPHPG|nr:alpha/beta hydrolase [Sphaerochaeta pleomorpha]AEV30157.1 putative hydrolase or acyltransferase of alpha/beta superfamily [Sphaerochaeta pleomorpha str. Grapes]
MKEFLVPTVPGILRYNDFPGEGVPILFIHGLGCAGSFDYPQVLAQSELKHAHCVAVDIFGSGYSDQPENFGYSVEEHASSLQQLVSHLHWDTYTVFGHSLGGAIALSLANLDRKKVSSIILSEANLDASPEGSTSKFIADQSQESFLAKGFLQLIEESRSTGNTMWAATLSHWSPKATYLIAKSAAEGVTPSWREILYTLPCKKTFIFGERTLPTPEYQELSSQGIEIQVVRDAGHSMAWENPQGLAQAIAKAL